MNTIKWFALSFGLAFGATFGALATAAPGDLVYEVGGPSVDITAAQAGCFAACVTQVDTATGDALCGGIAPADMVQVRVQRSAASETGFAAMCRGIKTSAPAQLPVSENGVRVVGIVE